MNKNASDVYLLIDRSNKKWFYMDFVYDFQGGEIKPFWANNFYDILCRGGEYDNKDEATECCTYCKDRYSLDLEVVKIEKCIEYSEIKK